MCEALLNDPGNRPSVRASQHSGPRDSLGGPSAQDGSRQRVPPAADGFLYPSQTFESTQRVERYWVDLASVLGQVASQPSHEGASFAQRTLCTLSVAGDRVTWPLPTAARRAGKWLERHGEARWPSTTCLGGLTLRRDLC